MAFCRPKENLSSALRAGGDRQGCQLSGGEGERKEKMSASRQTDRQINGLLWESSSILHRHREINEYFHSLSETN